MTTENRSITAPLFECRNVTRTFRIQSRELPVLKGISCRIPERAVTLITGRTGEGKSTLIGLLAGLDRPTSGQIFFKGDEMPSLGVGEMSVWRRKRVSVLFQHFNLLSSWTAVQNVQAALMPFAASHKESLESAHEWLRKVGLNDRADHLPAQLSAGQQQLVALARALAVEPEVIFADEPTGDVDPETGENIMQQLTDFVSAGKGSLVIASHGTYPRDRADLVFDIAGGKIIN